MKARHANDLYETDRRLTHALLKEYQLTGNVLECCAGNGAIAAALREHEDAKHYQVFTNDLVDSCAGPSHDFNLDATQPESWKTMSDRESINFVVTNPPFSLATQILPLAYEHARWGVAMLLRLSYLEPCKNRFQWLQEHPPASVIVFNPRPRWRDDTRNSDAVTVAWFCFHKFANRHLAAQQKTQLIFVHGWR